MQDARGQAASCIKFSHCAAAQSGLKQGLGSAAPQQCSTHLLPAVPTGAPRLQQVPEPAHLGLQTINFPNLHNDQLLR